MCQILDNDCQVLTFDLQPRKDDGRADELGSGRTIPIKQVGDVQIN